MASTRSTTMVSIKTAREYLQARTVIQGQPPDPADDDRIALIVDGVSERMEKMTGRFFVIRPAIVDSFVGDGQTVHYLKRKPVVSVASLVTLDSTGPTTIDPSTYYVDTVTGAIRSWGSAGNWRGGGNDFCSGVVYQATYSAGYDVQDGPALPADAVQVLLDYVIFCYTRTSADGLASGSIKTGEATATFIPNPPKDLTAAIAALADLAA